MVWHLYEAVQSKCDLGYSYEFYVRVSVRMRKLIFNTSLSILLFYFV